MFYKNFKIITNIDIIINICFVISLRPFILNIFPGKLIRRIVTILNKHHKSLIIKYVSIRLVHPQAYYIRKYMLLVIDFNIYLYIINIMSPNLDLAEEYWNRPFCI